MSPQAADLNTPAYALSELHLIGLTPLTPQRRCLDGAIRQKYNSTACRVNTVLRFSFPILRTPATRLPSQRSADPEGEPPWILKPGTQTPCPISPHKPAKQGPGRFAVQLRLFHHLSQARQGRVNIFCFNPVMSYHPKTSWPACT
jgi:hypothetical protein